MMTSEFDDKVVSMVEAAAAIESGDRIWAMVVSAVPIEFLTELCKRRQELQDVRVYSALLPQPFDFVKPEFRGHITNHSFFYGPVEKASHRLGNMVPYSYHLSDLSEAIENVHKPNVLAITVSPPDDEGYMGLGPCGAVGSLAALKHANKVIVSVNEKLSRVVSERYRIHVSQATHITLTAAAVPISPPAPESTQTEKAIAEILLPYINDGDTLQFGIGGIPNALGYSLESKKDLGIHTEMLTDCIVHLAKKGVVTGKLKNHHPNKIAYTFAAGSQELMEFMDGNDNLLQLPQKEIIGTFEAAKNDNFVSVNTCVMVDLTGQVAAEAAGLTQISATGGQLPLVRAAMHSKGGRAFIALTSTREGKNGTESNITIALPPGTAVTTPRSDAQYIITEFGVANMRQRSLGERAQSLIDIAHPDFREDLLRQAQEAGVISS